MTEVEWHERPAVEPGTLAEVEAELARCPVRRPHCCNFCVGLLAQRKELRREEPVQPSLFALEV